MSALRRGTEPKTTDPATCASRGAVLLTGETASLPGRLSWDLDDGALAVRDERFCRFPLVADDRMPDMLPDVHLVAAKANHQDLSQAGRVAGINSNQWVYRVSGCC